MKIVLDMMGGDLGSKSFIEAVLNFYNKHDDIEFFCVGDVKELEVLKDLKNVKIVTSTSILKMDVDPLTCLRDKTSSLSVAMKVYVDEKCDALISAGSTGALLSQSIFKIKRIEGITRPALLSPFPTIIKGKAFVACDLGANTLNTKEELHQFATMASLYYSIVYKKEKPNVYLLNNGTEEEKGNELTKTTYQLLKNDPNLNFKGNMEGRDPLYGEADVLVMDGFTGNIFLKSVEGSCKAMSTLIKQAFKRNIFTKIGYVFSNKGINEMKKTMDYKSVGGAILLGIDGIVMKAHGSSDGKAIISCLNLCYTLVNQDITNKIKENL